MELNTWEQILLEWVNCTGFLIHTHTHLKETDIEHFYKVIKKQINSIEIPETAAANFLKVHYPDFKFNHDDDNQINTEDYMYVYSLFLHFSCVRYPVVGIQELCKLMKENKQQFIALFLQSLLKMNCFDKDSLFTAISETVSISYDSTSPVRTTQRYSPRTPKTKMMDNWNLENKSLKAMIETERFEKGFLEVQLKQCEKKNLKISQDYKNSVAEIQDLKNKLLVKDTENVSSNKNISEEQIKRRLRKEIADKELLITQQQQNIEELKDENSSITQQLNFKEKELQILNEKTIDFHEAWDDKQQEVNQKDEMIKYLQSITKELELFIDLNKNNMDASTECLDVSFVQSTLNSSSNTLSNNNSPENLARSVIDVQLREQFTKNRKLSEELNTIQIEHEKFCEQFAELNTKYTSDIEVNNIPELLLPNATVPENFQIFIKYYENIVLDYKNVNQQAEEYKKLCDNRDEQILQLQNDNIFTNKRVAELTEVLEFTDKRLTETNTNINDLMAKIVEKSSQNEQLLSDADQKNKTISIIEQSIEKLKSTNINLMSENEVLSKNMESLEHRINELDLENQNNIQISTARQKQIFDLNEILNKLTDDQKKLDMEKTTLSQSLHESKKICADLRKEKDELHISSKELSNKITSLNTLNTDLSVLNNSNQLHITSLNSNNKELSSARLKLENKLINLNVILNDFRSNIMDHQKIQQKLASEKEHLNETILHLRDNINTLETYKIDLHKENEEMTQKHQQLDLALKHLKEQLHIVEDKKQALDTENGKLNRSISYLRNSVRELEDIRNRLETEKLGMQTKMEQLISDNITKSEENEQLKTKLLNSKQQIERIQMENTNAQKKHIDLSEKIQIYQEKASNFEEQNKKLNISLTDLMNKNSSIQTECDSKSGSLNRVQEELNNVKEQLAAFETEITKHLEYKLQRNKEYENVTSEITNLNNKLKDLEDDKCKLAEENSNNLKKINAQEKLNSDLSTQVKETTAKYTRLNEEMMKFEISNKELMQQIGANGVTLHQLQLENKSLQNILDDEKNANKKLKLSNQLSVDENTIAMAKLDMFIEKNTQLEEMFKKSENSCSTLEARLRSMENELSIHYNEEKIVKAQIEELLSEQIILEKEKEELQLEYNSTKENLLKHKNENKQITNTIDVLEEEKRFLKISLSKLEAVKNDLCSEVLSITDELKKKRSEISMLQIKLDENQIFFETTKIELENKLQNSMAKLSVHSIEIPKLIEECDELKCIIKNQQTEIDDFLKEQEHKNDFIKKQSELVHENTLLTESIEKSQSDIKELHSKLESVENEKQELIEKLNKLTDEMSSQCDKYDKLQNLHQDLRNENICLKNSIENNMIELVNLSKEFTSKLEIADSSNKNLKNIVEMCEHQIAELKEEKDTSTKKISELSLTLQEAYTSLQYTVTSADNKIQKLTKDLEATHNKINQSEKLLSDNQLVVTNTLSEKQTIETKYNQINNEFEILSKTHTESKEASKNLEKEMEDLAKEYKDLKKQFAEKLKFENEEALSQITKSQLELDTVNKDNINLKEEIEILKMDVKTLAEYETKCYQLEDNLTNVKEETQSICDQLKQVLHDQELRTSHLLSDKEALETKYNSSTHEIEILSKNLFTSNEKANHLENEISKLRNIFSEKETIETKYNHISNEYEILSKTITASNKSSKNLEKQITELTKEYKDLEDLLAEKFKSEVENQETLAQLIKSQQELQKFNDKLAEDNNDLKQEVEIFKTEVKTLVTYKTKCHDLEVELSNAKKETYKICDEHKCLEDSITKSFRDQIESITNNKCELEIQVRNLNESLDNVSKSLELVKSENTKLCDENNNLSSEVEKVLLEKKKISQQNMDLKLVETEKLNYKQEVNSLKETNEKLHTEANNFKQENQNISENLSQLMQKVDILETEKIVLLKKIEDCRQELNNNQTISENFEKKLLELENKVIANHDKKSKLELQLQKAAEQCAETNHQLNAQRLKAQEIFNAYEIIQAKLKSHREKSAIRETEWIAEKDNLNAEINIAKAASQKDTIDIRNEMEGKLEKMKQKMTDMYNKQTDIHKREIYEYKNKGLQQAIEIEKYEKIFKNLSEQMYQMNEEKLQFRKENENMKNKLRYLENKPHLIKRLPTVSMASSINVMEDEEGEQFNNVFLAELMSGDRRTSPTEQDSISLEELKHRNSMLPQHLRSSYQAQYPNQGCREEDVKIGVPFSDESIISNKSEGRRSTAYNRPGPPTPSKNFRLSLGAEQTTREVLKEHHNNSGTTKKTIQEKCKSIFGQRKVKEESGVLKRVFTNNKTKK